jgi:hypothetical protein
MPLSREAQQVSKDISEAADVFRENKINGALDPVALTIEIARLIGEERRGEKSKAGSAPLTSTRLSTGTDPVSVARRSPRVPFAPTAEHPLVESVPAKRSHRKKDVKTPVAPKAEPKARKRSSRRR